MARKKGQIYTAEQKSKIVLELLQEEQTVSQLATKYKVTAKSIMNWKRQFLENASKAFEDEASVKEQKKELEKLKKENDELAKLANSGCKAKFPRNALGKTTIERDCPRTSSCGVVVTSFLGRAVGKQTLPQKSYDLLGTPRGAWTY